ncbi:MAG: hypothetical protein ACRDT4_17685 [Micromonosporaceae bacterium]
MEINVPVLAGVVSTTIFAASMLPMLVKAARSRDLRSYSLGNILLSNVGNVIHSVYVFDLPAGPVWALHSFYLVSTALMLLWYVRYATPARLRLRLRPGLRLRLGLPLRTTTHPPEVRRMGSFPEAPALPTTRG